MIENHEEIYKDIYFINKITRVSLFYSYLILGEKSKKICRILREIILTKEKELSLSFHNGVLYKAQQLSKMLQVSHHKPDSTCPNAIVLLTQKQHLQMN